MQRFFEGKKWLLLIAIVLAGSHARAQGTRDTLILNLDKALEIALSDNPTIKVAEEEIALKKVSRKETWQNLLPEASITGSMSHTITAPQFSIRDTHEDYPEAMRWLAAKENVPLIDLNEMTRTLYEALGPDTSKRAFVHYPAGTYPGQTRNFADNTHFNPYGAYQIAQCVIEGMKKAVPELAKHLKIDPAYNPAHPDDVNTFHWNDSPFTEIEKPDGN